MAKATKRKPTTEVAEKLKTIIGRLEKEAARRVGQRKPIEDRWVQDIRQRYGQYDPDLLKELEEQDKSTLFINETGPKTVACAARLFDMLFPTDDRNWGIQPTPVPTLAAIATDGLQFARSQVTKAKAAIAAGDTQAADQIAAEANAQAETAEKADAELKAADKAADEMQREIEDQLKECDYAGEAREAIEDMATVGAGVMEGPVASDRVRQVWKTRPVFTAEGQLVMENGQPLLEDYLETVTDPRPAARRVDFWGVFPHPDAMKPEESQDWYVRHLLNEKQLRALARQPGFDKDAIRALLKAKPEKGKMPTYLSSLRNIGDGKDYNSDDRYVAWEYRGQLTAEDLIDVCECLGVKAADNPDRQKKLALLAEDASEADPLDEINVVIWFCQGELLKFGIHHLDRGDCIYSIVPLERDPSSIWGLGIPALMRDPQSALNGAWRMMMDNGGLSSGPMLALNRKKLKPVDGTWDLYARKLFEIADGTQVGEKLFEAMQIESNQADYAAMIELARQFIDSMSGQPMIAQGEQGTGVTKTAQGMALLMNSANVLIRRIVRNFDDRLTRPMIRRFYDWNMQFNKKRSIKGDFEVDARGSSVLLVKEMQSQNMMAFALQFAGHPIFGRYIKEYETLQEVAKTNMIPTGKVVKTEAEVKKEDEERANQAPPEDPAITLQKQKHADRMEELVIEENIEMMKLSAQTNVKLEDIRAWLADRREERASKERIFASEAAMETRNAGGGSSGGYLSAPPANPPAPQSQAAA